MKFPNLFMRVLLKEELRLILIKLVKYQGEEFLDFFKNNLLFKYSFRLQRGRIFYSSIINISKAGNFLKKKIATLGTCIGRLTKSGKFFILIPFQIFTENLDKRKFVSLTNKGEAAFTYGSNVTRYMIHEVSNSLKKGDGVVLKGLHGVVLGLGELMKSEAFMKVSNEREVVIINHADIGSYIRLT